MRAFYFAANDYTDYVINAESYVMAYDMLEEVDDICMVTCFSDNVQMYIEPNTALKTLRRLDAEHPATA